MLSNLSKKFVVSNLFKRTFINTSNNIVKFTLNGKFVETTKGTTILEACRTSDIFIPSLCYHPNLSPNEECNLCLVETDKTSKLSRACSTIIQEGMDIVTKSQNVLNSVKHNLAMILSEHPKECTSCESNNRCELQDLIYRYGIIDKFPRKQRSFIPKDYSSPSLIRDMNKCIKCYRCVKACSELQGMDILTIGPDGIPMTPKNKELYTTKCINCGACSFYCPVGAITENSQVREVSNLLKNKEGKTLVFQTAPATRVAISEEFGMEPGDVSTGKMVAALRKLGADVVFDTDFTADLTIMEEGSELLDRIKNGGTLPMFTSCCPGWINMVEKFYPEFIPNLSSCRSPQGMMSSLVKNYWAERIGIKPEDVVVVSIMPCTAKKDEAVRDQLKTESGLQETDYVLTTRELAKLIKLNKVKFASLKESEYNNPLGESTGAAVIFGNTGGVMEAALRTAYEIALEKPMPTLNYTPVRGFQGIKEATVDFGGIDLKVAVVHQASNIHNYMQRLKEGDSMHHFVEFMICKGGCIGGGGEPKSKTGDYLEKRMKGIYKIDDNFKIRKSHENKAVKQIYDQFFGHPLSHKSHHFLHTHYNDRTEKKEQSVKGGFWKWFNKK
ncbi:iron hydrogenase [Anaeramoeba flamelloides]|uniref:Iron hydrogenase n=1 Tax=Anaeramoeba flamelloides TaxID=1746091 RepID=A0ABQ8YHU9_9EUKA|nr:iron hydrogenase [Anaeramoeba flamelloides]